MLVSFDWFADHDDSKRLYFSLNGSFQIGRALLSPTYKMAGIYGIFKGNKCYYAGQSQNIASRLSTHLTGKYAECNEVRVYGIEDGFSDFYQRTNQTQKEILENNECWYINAVKPIENLMVSRDRKIPKRQRIHNFRSIKYLKSEGLPTFTILWDGNGEFVVLNTDSFDAITCIPSKVTGPYIDEAIEHYKCNMALESA